MASESPVSLIYGFNGSTYIETSVRSGIAVPVGQPGFMVLGSDGTNTRYLRLGADGTLRIDPTGTTTQPVTISDGVNGPATVKPPSTAPDPADKALVVVLSPNQVPIAVTTSPASSTAGFVKGDIVTAVIATFAVRRTTYTEQAVNAQRSVVSTNLNDNAAGTGVRQVKITYLTSTGTGPFTETVTLSGTTPVNTVATNICFIESMEAVAVGSTGVAAGTINLKAAVAGGGATIWSIGAGDVQTFGCHHYVPAGKVANITAQWAGHSGTVVGSGATFLIKTKPIGIPTAPEIQISDSFRLYGQSSSIQRNYGTPIVVQGPARLVTYVTPESSASINYRASFDFYET